LCFSGGLANDDDFCIRCEGDSSNCKRVLGLDELHEHLSSSTLDDVLETSFASHVRRRPEAFRYCPKPGCSQVYRASSSGAMFPCPECLTVVCTSCHEPHRGMTCADHQELRSGGYAALEKAKKQLGIKDCPKCKTALDKTDGCDHVTCGGCGTHMCWKCLATFRTGSECYSHLNAVHGSIGGFEEFRF
jgi:hypothetical protein